MPRIGLESNLRPISNLLERLAIGMPPAPTASRVAVPEDPGSLWTQRVLNDVGPPSRDPSRAP